MLRILSFIIAICLAPFTAQASTAIGFQALRAGDFATAQRNFSIAAQAGDADAQFGLCGMYFQGQGVPKNTVEAFQWCKLAADAGNVEAQYNTALFLQKGQGTGTNIAEATRYYKLAAEAGHKDAQFNLLQLYNANVLASAAGAAGGLAQGAGQVAGIVPPVGVPLDANGNAVSYTPLPTRQQVAQSVQAVPQQAARVAQAVPQQVVQQTPIQIPAQLPPVPQLNLTDAEQLNNKISAGCLQASQQGVLAVNCEGEASQQPKAADQEVALLPSEEVEKKDVQNTLGWFEKQAELGDLEAQNNLGVIYRRGTGVPKQPEKAFGMFEKSAARGSLNGMLNLANMYKLGEGVEQNLELAYAWYSLAADRLPAGEKKDAALENIKEISGFMNNQEIGSALQYVTQLDSTIPMEEQ